MSVQIHAIEAAVLGPVRIPLAIQEATLTMDEGWSPYVQADLTCRLDNVAAAYTIDPTAQPLRVSITASARSAAGLPLSALSAAHAGRRLSSLSQAYAGDTVRAVSTDYTVPGQRLDDDPPSSRVEVNLSLRSREIDLETGTMLLRCSSDEALLQDYGHAVLEPYAGASTRVRAHVQFVLGRLGFVLEADELDDAAMDPEAAIWDPGVDAWSHVSGPVSKADLRLWCDGRRRWHLTKAGPDRPGDGQELLAQFAVTAGQDSVSMDADWFDAVVIRYRWSEDNAEGTSESFVKYDTASMPGYRKVRLIDLETRFPGYGAAIAILRRKWRKSREVPTTLVSHYGATPNRLVAIARPAPHPIVLGRVTSVSWAWPADEMILQTRVEK